MITNALKRFTAALCCAALLIMSPGTGVYQILAAGVIARIPVRTVMPATGAAGAAKVGFAPSLNSFSSLSLPALSLTGGLVSPSLTGLNSTAPSAKIAIDAEIVPAAQAASLAKPSSRWQGSTRASALAEVTKTNAKTGSNAKTAAAATTLFDGRMQAADSSSIDADGADFNRGEIHPEWQKTPVDLTIPAEKLEPLTPAQRSVVGVTKGILAKRLFRWTNTDFSPPVSRFDPDSDQIVTVNDLFKRPNGSNEVGRIGRERRKINKGQMAQIKDGAAFTVPSEDFAGQEHEWKLGGLVQRGRRFIIEARNSHLAGAYENIRYRTVDRVTGDTIFSLRDSIPNFFEGLYETYGSFAGVPEERSEDYGVEQAVAKAHDKYMTDGLTDENRHLGLLYDAKIRRQAGEVLYDIERAAENAWEQKVEAETERIAKELAAEGLEGEALDKELADRLIEARQNEFLTRIAGSESLAKISPALPERLIARASSLSIIGTQRELIRRAIRKEVNAYKALLIEKHTIKSKVDRWLEGQVSKKSDALWAKLNAELMEKFPSMLRETGLEGEALLFEISRKFDAEIRPGIVAEMKADPQPNKTFRYRLRIWRKAAWKISRDEEGRYYASEFRTVEMPSDKHLWRVALIPLRFAQIASEFLYHLVVSNLWYGPLGIRSLLSPKPFAYEWYVDSETGKIVADSDRQGTLISRIRGLWAQRREILSDHERKDSYGFFGKGVERVFLFFTADLALGVIAPLAVFFGQIALTALNLGLTLAMTAGAGLVMAEIAMLPFAGISPIAAALAAIPFAMTLAFELSLAAALGAFVAAGMLVNPVTLGVLGSLGRWLFDGFVFDTTGTQHNRRNWTLALGAVTLGLVSVGGVVDLLLVTFGVTPITITALIWAAGLLLPSLTVAAGLGAASFTGWNIAALAALILGPAAVGILSGFTGTRIAPWFWTLGVKTGVSGIVLTIGNILFAVIVHPLLALAETLWGGLRAGVRTAYDKAMRGLIRAFARVPGRDSRYLVRRVRGPGLSNEFFFQIERALALVALWAGLERGEHSSYKARTQEKIGLPRRVYDSVMAAFSVLLGSVNPSDQAPGLNQIAESEKQLREGLAEAAKPNDELYSRLLDIGMTGSIKQSLAELEETVKKSAVITQDFYTKLFADRSAADITEFWKARSLKKDDWVGLAKMELGSIFGREFLTALETTDETLVLEVKAPSLGDYAAGLEEGILPEQLENIEVGDLGQPASGKERVRSPIPYVGGDQLTRGGAL